MYERDASVYELRQENRALQHHVQALRAQLEAATARADLAQKAARDAWAFARVALKSGRPREQPAP
jgi:hypothetical protein